MTSDDVRDGCASAGRAPAPCEFCAAFRLFRLTPHALRFTSYRVPGTRLRAWWGAPEVPDG
jgi:hypothetical protein